MSPLLKKVFLLAALSLPLAAQARPLSDTAAGQDWDFSSAGSWNGGPLQHGSWPIVDGAMVLSGDRQEVSARDPEMVIPARRENVVQITMTVSKAKTCQLFFTTGPDPVINSAKMVEFDLKPDQGPQTYNLDMSNVPVWANQVSSMKFVFPDFPEGAKVAISDIKVLVGDKISTPLVYTTFRSGIPPVVKEFRLGSLFNNNMVLQRQMNIPVWGHAKPGSTVSVEFKGATVTGTADADGVWNVRLAPAEAGGPYTMTVSDGPDHIDLSNILVGDVWVCSGQSNMGGRPREEPIPPDQKKVLLETPYPDLRTMKVATLDSTTPVSNTSVVVSYDWTPTPADPVMSAVSYYFGRELQATEKIPIGLLFIYKAGSQIEEWMSEQALRSIYTPKEYDEICGTKKLAAGLYNGMVFPAIPYGIKGAMWYQGESNATTPVLYMSYYKALPAFIKNWRDAWGEGNFPFMVVQLPQFAKGKPDAWPNVREAEFLASQRLPNVGLAVSFDTGQPELLHPKNKYVVGHHLALAALQMVYGEHIVGTGPMYQSMKIEGDKIVATFNQTGTGMVAKGDLTGFEVLGPDGKWTPAQATISGPDTVDVSAPSVSDPKGVRYAWAPSPTATLFNKEGLPASPFTSDIPKIQ